MIEWLVKKKIFRNANHAIWFICSIGFLLIFLGYLAKINLKFIIVAVALIAHLPPLITSIIAVSKKRASEIYSKDCIWFNAIILLIYFLLFTIY